jgi:DnaJ family protein C protein 3
MERGKEFLSKGQFADALQQYHAAVELDPTDYQIYFRRATVLLATGKVKAALPDLDKVVQLKPDFIAGRIQRGNILLKQGQLDDAQEDFQIAVGSFRVCISYFLRFSAQSRSKQHGSAR